MVQFADRFQFLFQALIVVQPPLGLIPSVYRNADLLIFSPRVSDGEHPNRVPLAASALRASLTMANDPAEQRTPQDLGRREEVLAAVSVASELRPYASFIRMKHYMLLLVKENSSITKRRNSSGTTKVVP
jgi:hypothetical protein